MRGKPLLAVAVCLLCFVFGYLAYLGTTILVDSVKSRVVTCLDPERECGQRIPETKRK